MIYNFFTFFMILLIISYLLTHKPQFVALSDVKRVM